MARRRPILPNLSATLWEMLPPAESPETKMPEKSSASSSKGSAAALSSCTADPLHGRGAVLRRCGEAVLQGEAIVEGQHDCVQEQALWGLLWELVVDPQLHRSSPDMEVPDYCMKG